MRNASLQAGSTGWLKSVYAGAAEIVEALGGRVEMPENGGRLPYDCPHLVYAVREPFASAVTETSMVFGRVGEANPLVMTSSMANGSVVFSDGMDEDFLEFNTGTTVTIAPADKHAYLVRAD